jgi:hypothetical protein
VVDGCNLYRREDFAGRDIRYTGIGRGSQNAPSAFVDFVHEAFQAVERGVANEVLSLVEFLNARYADGPFNEVQFDDVRRIAGTCVTGCRIVAPSPAGRPRDWFSYESRLADVAAGA